MTTSTSTTAVRRIVGPTILTCNGNYFDFEDPHSSRFGVLDIDDDGNVMTSTAELRGGTSSGEVVADPLAGEQRIAPADLPESGAAVDPFVAALDAAEKQQ